LIGLAPTTQLSADADACRNELMIGGWSRDGGELVVDAAIDGNSDVYIVHLDGRAPKTSHHRSLVDLLAAWSADERWIDFSSRQADGFR
jgi:Tol biopolymer transport system component